MGATLCFSIMGLLSGLICAVSGQSFYSADGLPYGSSCCGHGHPTSAYQPHPFSSNLITGSAVGYPTGSGLIGNPYSTYPSVYGSVNPIYPSSGSPYSPYPMSPSNPYTTGIRDPCMAINCGPGRYCEPLSFTSFDQQGGSYRCRRMNFNSPLVQPTGTKVGRCFDELVYKVPVGTANDRVRGGLASTIVCPDKCQRSQDCGAGQICCNNGCGNICHTPETTVIDTVNPSSPTSNGLSYTNGGYGLGSATGPAANSIGFPPASFFPSNRRMADVPSRSNNTGSEPITKGTTKAPE
ncbi:hypothetical protein RvY_10997 [Ramazzottius varieornatus]|uniref:WAP domain-containing protein n=1 Tax=Ramazzottius varieornatus TaxID=947166 RepID=A0A1D1VEN5_RAMVA|nr:hypothetical protein RvY_10997 [Ramazzottius varieornatus]